MMGVCLRESRGREHKAEEQQHVLRARGGGELAAACRTLPLCHSMNPDKVQSLKNQEGLPFSSHHHSLLTRDTRSAHEKPAHIVSSPQVSGAFLEPKTSRYRAVLGARLPPTACPNHEGHSLALESILVFRPTGLVWTEPS